MRTEVTIEDRDILEYVRDEFDIEDVFSQAKIKAYAGQTYLPEDLFSDRELRQWALENGFVEDKD